MSIFATGDSHSIFYHNSPIIKEHWVCFANLPVTLYRLINEGLPIYKIGTLLGNGHEKYNISSGDTVLFSYGYNDIQKNIHKYAKNNFQEEIYKLSIKYIDLIVKYQQQYQIRPIINCIYPSPLKESKSINGSKIIRKEYTNFMNITLKKICEEKNITFFDIYSIISDHNGLIKKEVTKDFIHLDYDNKILRDQIDTLLIKLIK